MRQKSELRGYQNRIATALYEDNEKLCVVRPGGGKTIAALTAIRELIDDGVLTHALIVAPKRVARSVWPDEIEQWAHTAGLRYAVLDGTPIERVAILMLADSRDITIIGIDLVTWLLDQLKTIPLDHPLFDLLVIDEVSKLRDPTGVRAKALSRVATNWKMIWGLSGTLRPSGPLDLFMPARVVLRAKPWGPSFYKWRQKYFYQADRFGYDWKPHYGAEDEINAALAPYIVTLADEEMPQLPELSVQFDHIELPSEARREYNDMEQRLVTGHGDKQVVAASAAVATGKLAQIANGFIYDDGTTRRIHEEKREWLKDVIDQAAGPTMLVYEFHEDLRIMRDLLGDDVPYLGQGAIGKKAEATIQDWNAGKSPFLVLHPAAGGHGLNLQHGGCDMAWISPTWSPELWEQTIARLHRSGQTRPVIVRVCMATGTVDKMKIDRVHYKMTAQQAFEAYLREFHAGVLDAGLSQ